MKRYCFIDDCMQPAVLVLHTYPDMTLLCAEHKYIHTSYREDWDPPDEPCLRPDPCELCGDLVGDGLDTFLSELRSAMEMNP